MHATRIGQTGYQILPELCPLRGDKVASVGTPMQITRWSNSLRSMQPNARRESNAKPFMAVHAPLIQTTRKSNCA